jgi:hypothetical protein
MDLLVVPPYSVTISPDVAVIPAATVRAPAPPAPVKAAPAPKGTTAAKAAPAPAAAPAPPVIASREVRVTVVNDTQGEAESTVTLDLPEGWTASPTAQPVKFTRQDESQTVRFDVRPGPDTAPGEFRVRAVVNAGEQKYDRGFEVIEYPHIRRRHIYEQATARLKILDVKTAPNLTVGYVMGTGDEVAPFIEQLGAKVEMIGPDGLAWGDLSRYNAIVLGVRAYERRDDLRANNSRLISYVQNGGIVIVQYNRAVVDDAHGPWPAKVSNDRITDENAPVRILEPTHPLFNTPNKITDAAWTGWIQERGLNFLGEKDSRYRDLVQMTDPFPNNPGDKRGALVDAQYGKGHWIYIALGLWRELPAGVDGAFPLLANLISLGARAPAPAPTPAPAARPARPPARPAPAPAPPAR